MPSQTPLMADVVLEGAGVKGVAHVGALAALEQAGYEFHRAAGTSAGSIVASFVAAGVPTAKMQALMQHSLRYRKVREAEGLARFWLPGQALSLLLEKGVYDGDYLRNWIHAELKEAGVEHFGDLRTEDPDSALGQGRDYRLVVLASDVTRGQQVRLPWDYPLYGLDPDRQLVADAVRASNAVPFFFKPVRLKWRGARDMVSYLVDGAANSDFPIEIFDRTDGHPSRWPTFGVKLEAEPKPNTALNKVTDTISFAAALLETMVNGNDRVHLADPSVVSRTVFVDTLGIQGGDFDIGAVQQQALFENGKAAAKEFLASWDWQRWLNEHGTRAERMVKARAAQRGRAGVTGLAMKS